MKFLMTVTLLFAQMGFAADTNNTSEEINSPSPDIQELLEEATPPNGNSDDLVPVTSEPRQIDLNDKTRLSLKKGYVIKSVNGESVESPAKAMELYNNIEKAKQLKEE